MCENRGERRKKTFSKAKKNEKVYREVCGCSSDEFVGELGRFKKDNRLGTKTDYKKTNSEWYGKKNYKMGDKKRSDKMNEQLVDYNKISKPNPHEFIFACD